MNIIREKLIDILNMKIILNKYGIKLNSNYMYHCPFHKDNHPSAKCYDKSFKCFSCGRGGDFIQFVQFLYNINFQQALEKIIVDFSLGLNARGNYDKAKIMELQRQDKLRELEKEKEKDYFKKLCKRKDLYNKLIEKWQSQITVENWEDMTLAVAYLQEKEELLNLYICDKYNIDN